MEQFVRLWAPILYLDGFCIPMPEGSYAAAGDTPADIEVYDKKLQWKMHYSLESSKRTPEKIIRDLFRFDDYDLDNDILPVKIGDFDGACMMFEEEESYHQDRFWVLRLDGTRTLEISLMYYGEMHIDDFLKTEAMQYIFNGIKKTARIKHAWTYRNFTNSLRNKRKDYCESAEQ